MPREYEDDFDDEDYDLDSPGGRRRRRANFEPMSHSGLGVASFIMSIVFGAAVATVFVVAVLLVVQNGGKIREDAPEVGLLGLGMICSLGLVVVGLGLGIAGLVQTNRKKVFSVLGVIFNLTILLGTGLLMILGQVMKH